MNNVEDLECISHCLSENSISKSYDYGVSDNLSQFSIVSYSVIRL